MIFRRLRHTFQGMSCNKAQLRKRFIKNKAQLKKVYLA